MSVNVHSPITELNGNELLAWLNISLQTHFTKVEQICTGRVCVCVCVCVCMLACGKLGWDMWWTLVDETKKRHIYILPILYPIDSLLFDCSCLFMV